MNEMPLILIVDDDHTARATMKAHLYKEPYELVFVKNGEEALTYLEKSEPDTILLDVMMPYMDGFEVCRQIKHDPRSQHIPIILVTALDSKADLLRGLEVGADEFLTKPVGGAEVRARVRTTLRIKKQYDDLQATLKLRENMVDMIVHDMRNPLAILLLQSEFMMREGNPHETQDGLKMIYAQAHRLDSFVNSLLIMAKMEKDKLILSQSRTDVNALIKSVQEGYQLLAEAADINFRLELSDKSEKIILDSKLFQRVLDNLVSNAIKFSPYKSTVTLRTRYPHLEEGATATTPHLRIEVLDEGRGVPEAYREQIFEKFTIIDTGREKIPQLGLGLAFCKMVAEQHNGRIYIQSNTPKGSIFIIEI